MLIHLILVFVYLELLILYFLNSRLLICLTDFSSFEFELTSYRVLDIKISVKVSSQEYGSWPESTDAQFGPTLYQWDSLSLTGPQPYKLGCFILSLLYRSLVESMNVRLVPISQRREGRSFLAHAVVGQLILSRTLFSKERLSSGQWLWTEMYWRLCPEPMYTSGSGLNHCDISTSDLCCQMSASPCVPAVRR